MLKIDPPKKLAWTPPLSSGQILAIRFPPEFPIRLHTGTYNIQYIVYRCFHGKTTLLKKIDSPNCTSPTSPESKFRARHAPEELILIQSKSIVGLEVGKERNWFAWRGRAIKNIA